MIMPLLGSGVLTKRQRVIPASFTGASFTGAYDAVPSITAAYGMRRLRTAYTGSILRLRRSSDNAEQDIDAVANGDLDTAAVSSFVGGGSGYIVNWYDQSGNGYTAAQATAASQPLYVASGQNGKPVGRWDGVNDGLKTSAFPLNQPNTGFLVYSKPVGNQEKFLLDGNTSNSLGMYFINATTIRIYAGAGPVAGTILDNGSKLMISYTLNGSNSYIWQNSVQIATGNAGTINPGGITLGMLGTPSYYMPCDIAELIICNAALSTGDRTAAESAANAYWSIY
jgi:hypothetical protein